MLGVISMPVTELSRCVRKFKQLPGEAPPDFFSSVCFLLANPGEEIFKQRSSCEDR